MTRHPDYIPPVDYAPVIAVLLRRAGGEITITEYELVDIDQTKVITTWDRDKRIYRITLEDPALTGEVVPEETKALEP